MLIQENFEIDESVLEILIQASSNLTEEQLEAGEFIHAHLHTVLCLANEWCLLAGLKWLFGPVISDFSATEVDEILSEFGRCITEEGKSFATSDDSQVSRKT